jgi:hypothetical protein
VFDDFVDVNGFVRFAPGEDLFFVGRQLAFLQ